MTAERLPATPRGLGGPGRSLWKAVIAAFEMRIDEEQTLLAACKMADDIAQLEAALRESTVWIAGSKGQQALNPIFGELRAHRLALAKLLRDCGIVAEAEPEAKSAAGRHLAGLRWHGGAEGWSPREVA